MKPASLGAFEELVLLAIRGLGEEAYGAHLQRTLERESGRAVSLGAVHTVLERLEAKRYITSSASEPTAQRGGRRRRLFLLTPEGRQALRDADAVRRRLGRLARERA